MPQTASRAARQPATPATAKTVTKPNLTITVSGNTATIVITDLAIEGRLSKSGLSQIIASTGGNVDLPGHDGVKLGINAYRLLG